MKFNEKLINLRKKEGLSQEELGFKLNVTRQTVSKWELGQTTPEMDKLSEMSKLFNISVDELINDTEITVDKNIKIEDQPINNTSTDTTSSKMAHIVAAVIIVVAVAVVIWGIIKVCMIFGIFNKVSEAQDEGTSGFESIFNKAENMIDEAMDTQENMINEFNEQYNETSQNIENAEIEMAKNKFNSNLDIYKGSSLGSVAKKVLDEVITINKTEDRTVTVEYNGKETQDETEIKEIKTGIETFDSYDVTFDYDADGYINKVTIEKE